MRQIEESEEIGLINPESASLLQLLGFNEITDYFYHKHLNKVYQFNSFTGYDKQPDDDTIIILPFIYQVEEWLLTHHNLYIHEIPKYINNKLTWVYYFMHLNFSDTEGNIIQSEKCTTENINRYEGKCDAIWLTLEMLIEQSEKISYNQLKNYQL